MLKFVKIAETKEFQECIQIHGIVLSEKEECTMREDTQFSRI